MSTGEMNLEIMGAREECRYFCEWTSPTLSLQGRYKEVGEYSVIKYYHETDEKEKKPRVSTHPNMWPSDYV